MSVAVYFPNNDLVPIGAPFQIFSIPVQLTANENIRRTNNFFNSAVATTMNRNISTSQVQIQIQQRIMEKSFNVNNCMIPSCNNNANNANKIFWPNDKLFKQNAQWSVKELSILQNCLEKGIYKPKEIGSVIRSHSKGTCKSVSQVQMKISHLKKDAGRNTGKPLSTDDIPFLLKVLNDLLSCGGDKRRKKSKQFMQNLKEYSINNNVKSEGDSEMSPVSSPASSPMASRVNSPVNTPPVLGDKNGDSNCSLSDQDSDINSEIDSDNDCPKKPMSPRCLKNEFNKVATPVPIKVEKRCHRTTGSTDSVIFTDEDCQFISILENDLLQHNVPQCAFQSQSQSQSQPHPPVPNVVNHTPETYMNNLMNQEIDNWLM